RNPRVLRRASDTAPEPQPKSQRVCRAIRPVDQVGCLAQVIPIGEAHLRPAVREYVAHYHGERNHQGIDNRLIDSGDASQKTVGSSAARGSVGCFATTAERRKARLSFGTLRGPRRGLPGMAGEVVIQLSLVLASCCQLGRIGGVTRRRGSPRSP